MIAALTERFEIHMPKTPFIFDPQTIHGNLDERFYRTVNPASFPDHIIRYRNQDAARTVGLADLSDDAWRDHFGRFVPFKGSFRAPLALCYHGHQFGHYNPDLGDGRGFLFAQARAADGRLLDMGTKGSGTTPFSRSADGRLTLKGAVREILATEMLQALGVNTSKTLSVIETGEALARHDEPSPTRSAVMVRLSHSHIRIGSFQRLSYMDDAEGIEMLTRHVIRHYYADDPALDLDVDFDALVPLFLQKVGASIATTTEKTTAHVIADAVAFITPNSVIPQKSKANLKKLESRHKILTAKLKNLQPITMAPTEAETIADGHVHIRGLVRNKGAKVPRGFITVASQAGTSHEIPEGHSGRLELAEWITDPQHPLTSRVMVNRIWKYLLGEGIVRTVDNFGKTGELPSHPKLLDHLAIQFTENNWSIKSLIREIVLSRTYQLSSKTADPSDPENRFFGRAHRKRLEAEAIRDTALHLSGQFDPIKGGPTIRNAGQYDLNYHFDSNRRSVYVPWFRNSMLPIFEVFDAPNPNLVVGRRSTTNLPTQALFLMNSPFIREQSELTAKRLLAEAGTVEDTYLLILSRPPSESERLSTQTFLASFPPEQKTEAWTQLTQALFSTIDFRFIN